MVSKFLLCPSVCGVVLEQKKSCFHCLYQKGNEKRILVKT